MKIRKKENGYVFDASDEAAPTLIARGDYEAYDEKDEKKEKAESAGQPLRRKSQK